MTGQGRHTYIHTYLKQRKQREVKAAGPRPVSYNKGNPSTSTSALCAGFGGRSTLQNKEKKNNLAFAPRGEPVPRFLSLPNYPPIHPRGMSRFLVRPISHGPPHPSCIAPRNEQAASPTRDWLITPGHPGLFPSHASSLATASLGFRQYLFIYLNLATKQRRHP